MRLDWKGAGKGLLKSLEVGFWGIVILLGLEAAGEYMGMTPERVTRSMVVLLLAFKMSEKGTTK